jgi:hypothetical protein
MTTTNDGLLKLDCLGRLRFSREQREAILDAFELSGLTGPQFCSQHGVKYQTFATWLQKRKRATGSYPALPALAASAKPFFVLAETGAALDPEASMEVRLPGGASLVMHRSEHAALVAALIRELAAHQSC